MTRGEAFTWFVGAPVLLVVGAILLGNIGVIGGQSTEISRYSDIGEGASLRTTPNMVTWRPCKRLYGRV